MLNKDTVIEKLVDDTVVLLFEKTNGEMREMTCTLSSSIVPPAPTDTTTKPRRKNPDVQAVWDTNAQGWRSFRWDKVKTVDGIGFKMEQTIGT